MAVPRKLTFSRALTQVRLAPKFPCRQQHPRLRAGNALRPPSLPVPARTGSRGDRRAAPLAHSAERAGQTRGADTRSRESPQRESADRPRSIPPPPPRSSRGQPSTAGNPIPPPADWPSVQTPPLHPQPLNRQLGPPGRGKSPLVGREDLSVRLRDGPPRRSGPAPPPSLILSERGAGGRAAVGARGRAARCGSRS